MLGYMEIVPQRDAATLLPLINAYVAAGAIIHSDEWAAYNQVQRLFNVMIMAHEVINHSVNFVEPTTGVQLYIHKMLRATKLEQSKNKIKKNERMSW